MKHYKTQEKTLTIDDDCSCGTPSLCDDIFRHTRVVGRVRKPGLFDDQIMIHSDVEITIVRWINDLFILQPFHLHTHIRKQKEYRI